MMKADRAANLTTVLTLILTIGLVLFSLAFSPSAFAKPPSEADFLASSMTAHEVGLFFDGLAKKPQNTAVFDVRTNYPLDPGFAEAIEGDVVRTLRDEKSITVVNCFECRVPKVEVRDDHLVVKRGMPDKATLIQLGRSLGVDSFLVLDVFRTSFALVTQVTLYQTSDGSVIGSTQIRIPSIDWSEAGLQLLLGAGPGFVSGGTDTPNSSNYNFGAHFSALEEVGFGKAGITLGGVGGARGGLGYVTPTVAWRGRYGATGIYSLRSIGVGFGTSDDLGGIAGRAAYTVMIGSFTVMGVEGIGFLPIKSDNASDKKPITFAGLFFIGLSIGR